MGSNSPVFLSAVSSLSFLVAELYRGRIKAADLTPESSRNWPSLYQSYLSSQRNLWVTKHIKRSAMEDTGQDTNLLPLWCSTDRQRPCSKTPQTNKEINTNHHVIKHIYPAYETWHTCIKMTEAHENWIYVWKVTQMLCRVAWCTQALLLGCTCNYGITPPCRILWLCIPHQTYCWRAKKQQWLRHSATQTPATSQNAPTFLPCVTNKHFCTY